MNIKLTTKIGKKLISRLGWIFTFPGKIAFCFKCLLIRSKTLNKHITLSKRMSTPSTRKFLQHDVSHVRPKSLTEKSSKALLLSLQSKRTIRIETAMDC